MTHGRTHDVAEGPAVPLLDLNSVLRYTVKAVSGIAEDERSAVRRSVRPLIHWATRNQDRHKPIGQKWCK